MHRFIPILANQLGARCAEVVTGHRARQFGQSKYGIDRTSRVLLDLATVKFLTDYKSSPMKMLGKVGILTAVLAVCGLLATSTAWLFAGGSGFIATLLIASMITGSVSVHMFALGLIGEMCTRIYYTASDKESYQVRDFVNFEGQEAVDEKPQFPRLVA